MDAKAVGCPRIPVERGIRGVESDETRQNWRRMRTTHLCSMIVAEEMVEPAKRNALTKRDRMDHRSYALEVVCMKRFTRAAPARVIAALWRRIRHDHTC